MATKKQKRALRNRQRLMHRPISKERQIRELMQRLDEMPRSIYTGQPIFPQPESAPEGE